MLCLKIEIKVMILIQAKASPGPSPVTLTDTLGHRKDCGKITEKNLSLRMPLGKCCS